MAQSKKLVNRKKQNADEMYDILSELNRVYYTEGGDLDRIAEVAHKALRIIRVIDNDLKPRTPNETER